MKTELYKGDCLEVMDRLIEEGVKVDAIITDPPYGTTACKWDSVIPFEPMWERLKKLRKDNTPIVLFGSEPFSSVMNFSNVSEFKYSWVWQKTLKTGFQLANKRPLKQHELISVFYKRQPTYNPQDLKPYGKVNRRGSTGDNWSELKEKEYVQKFTNYPTQILRFPSEGKTMHPTQKPVALLEYLIKTYTNEGETVLDFTMGSGTTGVACVNTNRNFIGIELDDNYFKIAEQRIAEAT